MRHLKKGFLVLFTTLGLLLQCIPVSAANVSYDFYLPNTKYDFKYSTSSRNQKIYAAQQWSLQVNTISFSNGVTGYGMAFVPMSGDPDTLAGYGVVSQAGNITWRTTTGITYGLYGNYGGATGYYYLGARMDSDLCGYVGASGKWNSDYVTF